MKRLDCYVQDQCHGDGSKTLVNDCQYYILCTTDIFAATLVVLMYYY